MGLYLSSHPLDRYDTYFDEQTHPLSFITAENNNKIITVGGIITAVRTILTKSNTKMAFVKIENKGGETEVIVFPSTFESCGAKLVVDNVIKATGKVNATDRDGNITSEVKVIAESIELISDETLTNYQPTGKKLPEPVTAAAPKKRYNKSSAERVYTKKDGTSAPNASPKASAEDTPRAPITPPKDPRKERLFILIDDFNDTEKLTAIRRLADLNLGFQEVILVLKDKDEKTPYRMPFHVDANPDLIDKLRDLLGDDHVKLA